MIRWVALSFVLALPAFAAPRSLAEVEEYARKLLLQAYQRHDVRAYCDANPDAVYQVEVGGNGEEVAVLIRCRAYHDWLATQK
jgi:hypothetical protein